MTPEPKQGGCGLWKYWWWSGGRFKDACEWHDEMYEKRGESLLYPESLWQADRTFLIYMIQNSNHAGHILQAFVMWAVAHIYGLIFWKGER